MTGIASLYGLAQPVSGLMKGIIQIPSGGGRHYADAAIDPIAFYGSLGFYLIMGVTSGFCAMAFARIVHAGIKAPPLESYGDGAKKQDPSQ
jgi:hypothetical protein